MDDSAVLFEVIRYTGVGIALVASFLIAPSGTTFLWRSSAASLRRLRDRLASSLPFLRRSTVIHGSGAPSSVSFGGNGVLTLSSCAWEAGAPIDQRIEALRAYITNIEARLNSLSEELSREVAKVKDDAVALELSLNSKVDELIQLLDEKDRHAARIDARGLPIVGFGILLSGIPDVLASMPPVLAWTVPVVGAGLTLILCFSSWREHRLKKLARH